MEEYIKIPSYLSLDMIFSARIKKFYKNIEIKDGKSDLEELRKYYLEDSEECIKLIREMEMRGFRFKTNKKENIFRKFKEPRYVNIIYTDRNNEKIKALGNSEVLKVANISDKENTSDYFFNFVPTHTFINMSHIDVELHFKRVGYDLITLNQFNKILKKYRRNNFKNNKEIKRRVSNYDKDLVMQLEKHLIYHRNGEEIDEALQIAKEILELDEVNKKALDTVSLYSNNYRQKYHDKPYHGKYRDV